jgi:lipoprotein-anchoring transpeptidase ErfK/SrfK
MENLSIVSACGCPGGNALRAALFSGVALVVLAGLPTSADAFYRRDSYPYAYSQSYSYSYRYRHRHRYRATPRIRQQTDARKPSPEREGFVDVPKGGVLQVAVSIANQRVTLFRDGQKVAQGPVSTGVPSNPTPMGVFSVIEKDRHHRSNIYSGAPMPFMQRITWSGIALHEGVLPGRPASHGCIRMSHDFAARLWPTTRLGVRVIISRHEIAPASFDHPSLFAPKPKPAEPPVAMNDAADGIKPGVRLHLAEAATTMSDAGTADVIRTASEPAKPAAPEAIDDRKPAEVLAVEAVKPVPADDAAEAVTKPAVDGRTVDKTPAQAADRAPPRTTDDPPQPADKAPAQTADAPPKAAAQPATDDDAVKATGTVAPMPPRDPRPAELRKAVEIPEVVEPPATAAAPEPAAAAATETAASERVKPAATDVDEPKPRAPIYRRAEQPPKRSGQVAVFVSRKEKKIFVRQGFAPLFDMPVVIEDLERPLGTHVFTALGARDDGSGMRWNVITIAEATKSEHRERKRRKGMEQDKPAAAPAAPATTAREALDRIKLPKEAVDRIGELVVPGSSLIVSDQGISHETGRGTEFIILTH